jgi:hypothetical protein
MKTPAVTNGRDSEKKPTRLRTDKEDTFVSYVANVVIYLRNNGVGLPVAIGVQNEPRSAVKWDGCVYEAGQFQRVTKLMRAALNKAGLQNVQLLVAEGAVYEDNEALLGKGFSALKSDKELSAAVGAIATHSYDQWDKNDSDDYRHLLSFRSAGKMFHVFKKVWNTVRPGWRVKKMTSLDSAWRGDNSLYVNMVAFENRAGTKSCVILVNESMKERSLRIDGLKGTTVNVYRTTATENQALVSQSPVLGNAVNGSCSLALPPRSIVVITT